MNEVKPKRKKKSRARSFAAWLSSFTLCCCCMPNFGPPARMPPIVIQQPAPQPLPQPKPPPIVQPPIVQPPIVDPKANLRITRANFNRLKDGMSLQEVEAIIGPNIQKIDQNGLGVWDKYPNTPGRTRMTITFFQGRLNTKVYFSTED
jgi:hypothetical protein